MSTIPKPIIIDTDMASDDWLAILYLLKSPLAEVMALTLAATGGTHTWPGLRTGLRLLGLVDQVGIPVAAGRSKPLKGNNSFALLWRVAMDMRLGLRLPSTPQKREKVSAVQLMVNLLTDAKQPVTIVALGPLTNVAELIKARPDLQSKIAKIVIMGGAFDVAGNVEAPGAHIKNPYAEWNIYADPYAANVTFQSAVPVLLVPLDATNKTPLTLTFFRKVKADHRTPAAEFVYRVLNRLKSAIDKDEYFFWDPLTAVLATHENIGEFTSYPISVVEAVGPESGRTVAGENGPNIQVCTGVNQADFEEIFLKTLNSL